MASETITATAAPSVGAGPGPALRIGWLRGKLELTEFFRHREQVFFTLAFPVMLLLIFGSIFNYTISNSNGLAFARYFVPGILAVGLFGVAFQTLAIQIAVERDKGTLKRLEGTPMPPAAYFVGKVIMVLALVLLESILLLIVAKLLGKVTLPSDWHRWLTFFYVTVLGVTAGSLFGIAYSSVPRSGKAAPAVVTGPALVLQFLSGVYFVFGQVSHTIQYIGALFPLKWIAQGYRSVFLPDRLQILEPAHRWEPGRTALVLGLWSAGALFVALRTFRWRSRADS
ncbi:MAG TPA: ABC transporter permease [Micromonosporaceae bacterium]|nr:ABC transporter permease [Micromonosporaceae bacterium]